LNLRRPQKWPSSIPRAGDGDDPSKNTPRPSTPPKLDLCRVLARRRGSHVNGFIFLSKEGFYDSAITPCDPRLHDQGGDPTGTGMGGPGYKLKQEFNPKKHVRGVLSAAAATTQLGRLPVLHHARTARTWTTSTRVQ
jgi:hypothetical protein